MIYSNASGYSNGVPTDLALYDVATFETTYAEKAAARAAAYVDMYFGDDIESALAAEACYSLTPDNFA